MKIIINQLCLISAVLAISTRCSAADSSQSKALEVEGIDIQGNPFAAIQKVMELGKQAHDGEIANRESVEPVSFKD